VHEGHRALKDAMARLLRVAWLGVRALGLRSEY